MTRAQKTFEELDRKACKIEQFITSKLYGEYEDVLKTEGNHNGDIYFNGLDITGKPLTMKVEVKSHPSSLTTGKIAVEFINFLEWKPSGLSIADSDYWVEVFYNKASDAWEVYRFPTHVYKDIIRNAIVSYPRKGYLVQGGVGSRSGMVLIYVNYLVKVAEKYYVCEAPRELFEE